MVIFKTSSSSLNGVLSNCKHAFHGKIKCSEGDVILIQETLKSLKKGERPIRWAMDFVRIYEDKTSESLKIWGKQWKYIIEGKNVRPVEPFNMSDVQYSNKNYKNGQTHIYVDKQDEESVLNWITENESPSLEASDLAAEFDNTGRKDINVYIDYLNNRYEGKPEYKTVITNLISRPSPLRNAIILRDGTKCRICDKEGFMKRNGKRYCEVHHMVELNKKAPNTLQSWNVIVVCPNCHKELHHGQVQTTFLAPGWHITIGNRTYILK